MNRFFGALLLGATLIMPIAIQAQDQPRKYYDRDHKDYHVWNDGENSAYHRFLTENHRKDHEWAKANRKEQQEYWNWRHEHPDAR